MRKSFLIFFSMMSFIILPSFADELKYDSEGNIYFEYGTKKFTDKSYVDNKTFNKIRIFDAIYHSDWRVVKEEIDSGIDINSSVYLILGENMWMEKTLLSHAYENGQEEIAKKLIDYGADIDHPYSMQMGAQRLDSTILTCAFNNADKLSKDFLLSLLKDTTTVLGNNYWAAIGLLCDVDFSLAAYRNYSESTTNIDEKVNCVNWLIIYACLKNNAQNGDRNIPHGAIDIVTKFMEQSIFLKNPTKFFEIWDNSVYPTLNKVFVDDSNLKFIVELYNIQKQFYNY